MSRIDPALGPTVDLPGVVVYTAERVRRGFGLTNFLVSLRSVAEREAFANDPEATMERQGLTPAERDLVRRRDYDAMLDYGASIYALGKASGALGTDLIAIGAASRGERREDFLARRLPQQGV